MQARLSCQALTKLSSLQKLCLGSLIDPRPESLEGLLSLTALKQLSFHHFGRHSLDKTAVQILAQLTSLTSLSILPQQLTPGYDLVLLPGGVPCTLSQIGVCPNRDWLSVHCVHLLHQLLLPEIRMHTACSFGQSLSLLHFLLHLLKACRELSFDKRVAARFIVICLIFRACS